MELDYLKLLERAKKECEEQVTSVSRFKMPKAVVEYQGRKTIIRNFKEIADTFKRDKKHLAKFLFRELATPGFELSNSLVLTSRVSATMIQTKLEKYAKEYVFCRLCNQPDTRIVKERRVSFIKCEACGAKYPLSG